MQQSYGEIARRVKALREIAGIKSEIFADELKLDRERYLRYENGEEDIPVGVLLAAAERLEVDVTSLISGAEPRMKVYSLVRKGHGLEVERRKEYRYRDLSYNFAGRKADAFLVTVGPTNDEGAKPHVYSHEGQEFNYVLKGRMKVIVNEHELVLEEGDSLYFDSGREHAMVALGDEGATFLAVTVKA
jgi:mannose-6-phosphate isomerase-like protein (cupin superfamily)